MFGKSRPEVQLVEDDPPPVTRDVPPPNASSLATALVIDSAKEVPSEETELFTQDENLTPKTSGSSSTSCIIA